MTATTDTVSTLRLKQGGVKPLHAGHPWVFADAVAEWTGPEARAGDEVRVVDGRGTFIGRGFYSPSSAIAVRLLTRLDEPVTAAFLAARVDEALRLRRDVLRLGAEGQTTAYRLINSEGDGLGGLTVDVYGPYLAVQIGTAGMERRLDALLDILEDRLKPAGILDRSAARIRKLEKLEPPRVGPLRGAAPAEPFAVLEHGVEMLCDLRSGHGQKTGLYLDQRENRRRFASLAAGRKVLDAFCYTGGFALHAAQAGAQSLTLLESSENALQLARANLERNRIEDADLVCADWAAGFKALRDAGAKFDLICLDPPSFTHSRENVSRALSGYRDLNAQAARLLAPGGLLFTFSCSGNVSEVDFQRAVAAGLHAAGRRAALLERRGAACDHPAPPGFDQGRYLQGLLLFVL